MYTSVTLRPRPSKKAFSWSSLVEYDRLPTYSLFFMARSPGLRNQSWFSLLVRPERTDVRLGEGGCRARQALQRAQTMSLGTRAADLTIARSAKRRTQRR